MLYMERARVGDKTCSTSSSVSSANESTTYKINTVSCNQFLVTVSTREGMDIESAHVSKSNSTHPFFT